MEPFLSSTADFSRACSIDDETIIPKHRRTLPSKIKPLFSSFAKKTVKEEWMRKKRRRGVGRNKLIDLWILCLAYYIHYSPIHSISILVPFPSNKNREGGREWRNSMKAFLSLTHSTPFSINDDDNDNMMVCYIIIIIIIISVGSFTHKNIILLWFSPSFFCSGSF